MKKYLVAGCIILAILLSFSWYKSCQESPKEAYWRGQYEIIKANVDAERVELLKEVESLEGDISKKDERIVKLGHKIQADIKRIAKKDQAISKLEITYRDLKNDTERVDNLTQQVVHWKEKFTSTKQIVHDKDETIFSLTEKYKSQLKISTNYKTLYENECKVSKVLTMRLDICTKRTKSLRFGGTVKSGIVLTLAGIMIYGMVK